MHTKQIRSDNHASEQFSIATRFVSNNLGMVSDQHHLM